MQDVILEPRTELKDIKTSRQTRGRGTNNHTLQIMSKSQSEVSSGGEETVWAAFAMEINLSNLKASTPVFLGLTEGERDKKKQEIILSLVTSTPKGTQTFHPHLQYITDSFPQSGKRRRLKNQRSFYDIITD